MVNSNNLKILGVLTATLGCGAMFGACSVKERPGETTSAGGGGASSASTESTSSNGGTTTGGGGDATSASASGTGGSTSTGMACTGVEVSCPSGCADLMSDGANCNACGHSCLGGACLGGACQPVVLASALGSARELAVDTASVYWTDPIAGAVSSVPIAGGAVVQLGLVPSAWAIATDGVNVYATEYSTAGGIYSIPVGGGATTTLATGLGRPTSIALADGWAYHADQYTGEVNKTAIDGTANKLVLAAQGAPPGIATDATYVYWTDGSSPGTVKQWNAIDSSVATLATAQDFPLSVTTDATNVYWTNQGPTAMADGSVMMIPKSGGSPVVIADKQDHPSHIATNGINVYWTTAVFGGSVMSAPIAGGAATVLATGQAVPTGIAVDAASVYWANLGTANGDGAVMKLAK